jgi:glutamate--cysteine ligase
MPILSATEAIQPIESKADLIAYLARGGHSAEQRGIGAEMEKLLIDVETGRAADFDRIEQLLLKLEESPAWQGVRENDRLIGLTGSKSSITLEPGGQMELSGELCSDIHCSNIDYANYIAQITPIAKELGLAFLGLGVQPISTLEQIAWLPKDRYGIMSRYMLKTGQRGQQMMKQTAGLQVNFDFQDEADCIDLLRLSMRLSPLLYALFANSPLLDGHPSGFLSTRGEIWHQTDPDRTGLIPSLFEEGAGFETYVDYALQVPMYFLVRDGKYIDLTGNRFTFAQFLREGHNGETARLGDWDLHLSTLFPEVRLRPQVEVRSADSLPSGMSLSVAALLKGLFYDDIARMETVKALAGQDLQTVYPLSWRLGLKTPCGNKTLLEPARVILAIARDSLQRQGRTRNNCDETIYLDGLDEIVESGVTLAERLLSRWHGSDQEKLQTLLSHSEIG